MLVCRDNPTWQDEDGYNCRDYERDVDDDVAFLQGLTRCDTHGAAFGANQECCTCGGGYNEPFVPSHAPTISFQPQPPDAVASVTTVTTSPTTETCANIADWVDIYGDDCRYYAEPIFGEETGNKCSKYGMYGMNHGYTAHTACCVCGGGVSKYPNDEFFPVKQNVPLRPIKPTLNVIGDKCIDRPNWEKAEVYDFKDPDEERIGCSSYFYKPKAGFVTCGAYGHIRSKDGTSANDACCICNGGYSGALIGRTFRVTFPGDADALYTLFTKTTGSGAEKDGSIPRFMKEVANATGFGMFQVPLSKAALEKSANNTYDACMFDLTLGNTDMCIGPFWMRSLGNDYNNTSASIFKDEFYLVVKKTGTEFWALFFTPVLPFTPGAWLWIASAALYMGFVINVIHKNGVNAPGSRSCWSRFGSITYNSIMSCAGGEVANANEDPSKAEKFVLVGFAVFGLIILTAYTATSAAFLVAQQPGYGSLADVVAGGATTCVHRKAYGPLLVEHPQMSDIVVATNYNVFELLDTITTGECDAVVISTESYNYAQHTDSKYCSKLKILKQDVIMAVDNVIPTYELLDTWGDELIRQINQMIEKGVYAKYNSIFKQWLIESFESSDVDAQTYLSEKADAFDVELRRQSLRLLRGGKGGASAGGGAIGGQSSISSACGDTGDSDSDNVSLSSANIFFPLFLTFSCSSVGLCMFFYNRKVQLSMKIHFADSQRFGKHITISPDEEDDLIRIQLEDLPATELLELLREAGIDEDELHVAIDELPDKSLLVEVAFQQKCSDYRRDYDLLSEWLSTSELCVLINHFNDQNSLTSSSTPSYRQNASLALHKNTEQNEQESAAPMRSSLTSRYSSQRILISVADTMSHLVRKEPNIVPSISALNDHEDPKGELIEEIMGFPKLMELVRECVFAKKKTRATFHILEFLNGLDEETPLFEKQFESQQIAVLEDTNYRIVDVDEKRISSNSALTEKSDYSLFDHATQSTNDLLVNSLSNSEGRHRHRHIRQVRGQDGTAMMFYE